MKRGIVICAVALSAACGGGSTDVSNESAAQEFLFGYCLPLADIFTQLAEGVGGSNVNGAPVDCPGGGTAVYDPQIQVATLDDCSGAGATVSGSVNAMILVQEATITGGTLSISGAFSGTLNINSGYMSWELPVADATTFWQLFIDFDGEEQCLWSGADSGPCMDLGF